jgi:creatinine amidohydrolase
MNGQQIRTLVIAGTAVVVLGVARINTQAPQRPSTPAAKGTVLADLTWVEAKARLTPDTVVVIPLGAESKEHGPHLKLRNDWTMAEYLKDRVLQASEVVVAPTINYHFYPAFVEYPGSTTLRLETARDVVVDICKSLAAHGPRRFYVLNTGVSTLRALAPAAEELAKEGLVLRYTNVLTVAEAAASAVREQKEGTHADEIETSIMLFIDPASVNMSKATRDYPTGQGVLTPDKSRPGRYSPSGVYGDATLATRAKGEKVVEAKVTGILSEIEQLRRTALP